MKLTAHHSTQDTMMIGKGVVCCLFLHVCRLQMTRATREARQDPLFTNELPDDYDCPDDYSVRLYECVTNVNYFIDTATSSNHNQPHGCSNAVRSLNCIVDLKSRCQRMPGVVQTSSYYDVDQMRAYISLFCPEENQLANFEEDLTNEVETEQDPNPCDVDYPQQALDVCNAILQSSSNEDGRDCVKLEEGFACFRDLVEKCSDHSAVVEFEATVDLRAARQALTVYCPLSD